MKILIIEDEILVAESLIRMLKKLEPSAEVEGPLASVKATLNWLASHPEPDLIVSDIQLSDGISLDIFSGFRFTCPIIFTTAYNEYAIRAFKVNSIDYLLKPIDKNELGSALAKFHLMKSKFNDKLYLEKIKELFADLHNSRHFKERFAVHTGRSVTLVPIEEISYFVKEELIFLINKDGLKFITDYRSLDEIEELIDHRIFYRANRQHLVHLPFITSYRGDDTGKVVLKMNGIKNTEIIISKEKSTEFKGWIVG